MTTSKYRQTFALVRERWDNFEEAIRALAGDAAERRDWIRAARCLIKFLWWMAPNSDRRPPRISATKQLLAETRSIAERLMPSVLRLSELMVDYRDELFPSPLIPSETRDQLCKAGILGAHPDLQFNHSALYAQLRALEAFCHGLQQMLPPDRGGSTTLVTGKIGNWKARLVAEAGYLFSNFRPGEITSTEGGPFYLLCCQLYELIIGQEAEGENIGLKRYVGFVVPRIKRLEELFWQKQHIELGGSYAALLGPNACDALADLSRKIQTVHDELRAGPSISRCTA